MTTIYVSESARKALPKRDRDDFYPTPYGVALDALNYIPGEPQCILDPGAGTGVWGRAAREHFPRATITGVDVRPIPKARGYHFWFTGDYLLMDGSAPAFDLVVGNPPYKYAEQFVRQSWKLLEPGGYLVFLLRLNFLEGQGRRFGIWRTHPLKECVVCSKRVSFSGDGKTNATAYGYFIWQKGWRGTTSLYFG